MKHFALIALLAAFGHGGPAVAQDTVTLSCAQPDYSNAVRIFVVDVGQSSVTDGQGVTYPAAITDAEVTAVTGGGYIHVVNRYDFSWRSWSAPNWSDSADHERLQAAGAGSPAQRADYVRSVTSREGGTSRVIPGVCQRVTRGF